MKTAFECWGIQMDIKFLIGMSKIKQLSAPDRIRAKSLIEASERTMRAVQGFGITDETATIVFRETYESIRQLGDARWWLKGFKPKDHEVSMEVLKEEKISHSTKLQKLDRFRAIRNEANYQGYMIPRAIAQEIIGFWRECGEELLENLKKCL